MSYIIVGSFVFGFITGVVCVLRWSLSFYREQLKTQTEAMHFWRNRWVDLVRRLDEQDVTQ